jgi:hypothetical protein
MTLDQALDPRSKLKQVLPPKQDSSHRHRLPQHKSPSNLHFHHFKKTKAVQQAKALPSNRWMLNKCSIKLLISMDILVMLVPQVIGLQLEGSSHNLSLSRLLHNSSHNLQSPGR